MWRYCSLDVKLTHICNNKALDEPRSVATAIIDDTMTEHSFKVS